ncbi:uncharacterized protein A4U43_C05F9710 [Asparagus officinalis]|uniref:H/ACA ribonucleoprotein complex subunit n=1 Tax=Asparagus officinalis TaxID=4686 RepID=A0A5P1EVY5_ASPOF|nr:uncharacterized protein A4U43_C05F9710 [Asparagus officinalis]
MGDWSGSGVSGSVELVRVHGDGGGGLARRGGRSGRVVLVRAWAEKDEEVAVAKAIEWCRWLRGSEILSNKVIMEGSEKHSPLNEGSILWITETRLPLGRIDEVFGPVKNPFYVVRYNSDDEVPQGISIATNKKTDAKAQAVKVAKAVKTGASSIKKNQVSMMRRLLTKWNSLMMKRKLSTRDLSIKLFTFFNDIIASRIPVRRGLMVYVEDEPDQLLDDVEDLGGAEGGVRAVVGRSHGGDSRRRNRAGGGAEGGVGRPR